MSEYAALLIALAAGGFLFVKMAAQKVDAAGLIMLKKFESWRPIIYKDEAGLDTIGFGHLIKPGESFGALTLAEGEALLKIDLAKYEKAVNDYVDVKITQSMFNSLASFTYNVGVAAFRNSTMLRKLNAGDYEGARNEFARWNKITINGQKIVSAGLTNRRNIEAGEFFA